MHVTGAVTDVTACLVGETLRPVGQMKVFADSRSVAEGTRLVSIQRRALLYLTEACRPQWRYRKDSSLYD